MKQELIFKAGNWQSGDPEEDEIIYISGHTQENKTVMLKIYGFQPYVFIQLPDKLPSGKPWNELRAEKFVMFVQGYLYNTPPKSYEYEKRIDIYGKIKHRYIKLFFGKHKDCRYLKSRFDKELNIEGLGVFPKTSFMVHEQNIDPIVKFAAQKKIKLGGWIIAKGKISNFSSCDISMETTEKYVLPTEMPPHIQTYPTIVAFDLECCSENHDSTIPSADIKGNYISQISIVFFTLGDPEEKWKKYLLSISMGTDFTVKGSKVFLYDKEKDLILGFTEILEVLQPDILTGYNILKFDWPYLITRAVIHGIYEKFTKIGKIPKIRADKRTQTWSSSAYGDQTFQFLEPKGMLNLDVMIEIERNHKMDSYSLDAVSTHFLGEQKKPVSAKSMFKLTYFAEKVAGYFGIPLNENHLKDIKKIAEIIFYDMGGICESYLELILSATLSDIKSHLRKPMAIIGDYCVWDSVLAAKLLTKMNIVMNMVQLSNVFSVPISYLQCRGQQVKVLSQVYNYTIHNNFVIPFKDYKEKDMSPYQGATVIDAVPGLYKNIVNLDFMSLYPTVMISQNIDFTTYVTDDSIPDSMCNVLEWDEHIGCIHDEKKRKKGKDKVICGHCKDRWLKAGDNLENEGILPKLLRGLLDERKKVKGQIKDLSKKVGNLQGQDKRDAEITLTVLDALQLAIKISANSIYGGTGARTGPLVHIRAAASTTAGGRMFLNKSASFTTKNYINSLLIYGDTDSTLIKFDDGNNIKKTFEIANKAAKECTALFPSPVELEFECVYGDFFLLTKKRYIAHMVDSNGKVTSVVKKGVVTKRRDNTHFLKTVYGALVDTVMNRKSEHEFLDILQEYILKLLTSQVSPKDLIIYKGVKTLINYARSKEIPNPKKLDNKGNPMVVKHFLDKNKKPIMLGNRPYATEDPLDPMLVYGNDAHVQLALKMKRRGEEVPPNTRLRYVLTDVNSDLQCDKVEDYQYFIENKKDRNLKLDYLYYLEKQIIKPVSELVSVIYKKPKIEYKSVESLILKEEELLFQKITSTLKESIIELRNMIVNHFGKPGGKVPDYKKHIYVVSSQLKKHNLLKNNFDNLINLYFKKKSINCKLKLEAKFGIKKQVARVPKSGLIEVDGDIIQKLFLYRKNYKAVVDHLDSLFFMYKFV